MIHKIKQLTRKELKEFLDLKADHFNRPEFIEKDPVSIPHMFTEKEDIEVSGFLTAIISWGRREGIIKSASKLMQLMDMSPYDFILNGGPGEIEGLNRFVHRTFNGADCMFFTLALRDLYDRFGNMENAFYHSYDGKNMLSAITGFRQQFLRTRHLQRSEKHLADPSKGASAKRINMFLRWMVRKDQRGVDFGIWNKFHPGNLYCPLDVHSAKVARKLGLLKRKQNDWKAVSELTFNLRKLDPHDPVKYDFALFGLGIYENF